jgi:hypothetical protein
MTEATGNNGIMKGIKRSLSCSEDEDGFLGFDTGERRKIIHFANIQTSI